MAGENVRPTDILELLDYYGLEYKMVGNVAMMSCLFHPGDNTPSMAVYPETNSFFCFGCATSGTSETLVMKMENCSYKQAVKFLYGDGYEWRTLRSTNKNANKVDESYMYNIIGRNLRKEIRGSIDNKERLDKLKQLVLKYASTQVDPKNLFKVLRTIKTT